MNGQSHRLVTQLAFDLLRTKSNSLPLLSEPVHAFKVAYAAKETDHLNDVEFVNVEFGRDNPHKEDAWTDYSEDTVSNTVLGHNFTTFNHFIDIKKGRGSFDDYDGYAYEKGSARSGDHQEASDAFDSPFESLLVSMTGKKVDEGLNWYFNDEYVHVKGMDWYSSCSPATERYSYYNDRGVYASVENELKARFPLAESAGGNGKGIPYSVFMPVDNLARYWLNEYIRTKDLNSLGNVMHAIQDAVIPHHSAGYCGNWHGRYEDQIDISLNEWLNDPSFHDEILELFDNYYAEKEEPSSLGVNDWGLQPGKNWKIESLVTWLALHSYKAFESTYSNFTSYNFIEANARELTKLAAVVSMVIIGKAAGYTPPQRPGRGGAGLIIKPGIRVPIAALAKQALISTNKIVHDFGIVWPGESGKFTFEITSNGKAPLTIESVTNPTYGVFKIVKMAPAIPATLKPGEVLKIMVQFTRPASLKFPGKNDKLIRNSPLFEAYNDEIIIKSDAVNMPLLVLHLRAGGRVPFKSAAEVDSELSKYKRQVSVMTTADSKKTLDPKKQELERLKKILKK